MEAVMGMSGLEERRAAAHHFDLSISGKERASLVRVIGPLDIQHADGFLDQVRPLCGPQRRVVVDLRAADYVDSSGVRALMELDEKMLAQKGDLRLVVQPGSRVERVLGLLRLLDKFHVYNSASEAWQERTAA